MHDFHLANHILKTALEYANKNGFKKVSRVEIELGNIIEHGEQISKENLIYNFKLLSKSTIAENAEIKINKIKGDTWRLLEIDE